MGIAIGVLVGIVIIIVVGLLVLHRRQYDDIKKNTDYRGRVRAINPVYDRAGAQVGSSDALEERLISHDDFTYTDSTYAEYDSRR